MLSARVQDQTKARKTITLKRLKPKKRRKKKDQAKELWHTKDLLLEVETTAVMKNMDSENK